MLIPIPATTVTGNVLLALRWVGLAPSVTVTFTVAAPAAVGVPVIAPVEALMASPAGRPVTVQLYG